VGKGEVLASFPTEIKYGTMSRQVSLPENVDAYTATSRYNDGTLYVNFKLQKTDVVFVVKVE
jgi:HSP20 family molecular chaperone IbpA